MSTPKAIAEKAKSAIQNGGKTEPKKEIVPIPRTLKGMKTTDINKIFDLQSLQIAQLVPKHLDAERVMKIFSNYVRRNPEVADCSTESVVGAMMQCAELGFLPTPALQQVYFSPRRNKKNDNRMELEFGLQYQGKLDLMYRSGKISNVRTRVVYENDFFEITYGDEEKIVHKPILSGEQGAAIGVYCIIQLTDGQIFREYMNRDEVYHVRESSDAYRGEKNKPANQRYGPWFKQEGEMWRKTVLNRASKYAPKSIEFAKADLVDGRVINPEELQDHDILSLNEPENTDFIELPGTDQPEETAEIETSKTATPVQLATITKYAGELKGKLDDKDAADLEDFLAGDEKTFEDANSWIEFLAKKRK